MILLVNSGFINTKLSAYVRVVESGEEITSIYAHTGEKGFEIDVRHDPIPHSDRIARCRKLAVAIAKNSNSDDAYFVARDLTLRML
jgi:hypothetical protein